MRHKDILQSHAISPRKMFGQNFLLDKNIAKKIIAIAEIKPDDVVMEIGPGIGALTELLIETGARIVAIEIDRELFGVLKERFAITQNLEILNADALKVSYKDLADRFGRRLKVVSNLPYNISTPILFKFLDERDAFSNLVLMFQKEVADRICAKPSCKDYGILSVFAQMFADVKIGFTIPPSAFYPKPKVYSKIIRLDVLKEPRIKVHDMNLFKEVVRASFNQRRKTLPNALKGLAICQDNIITAFKQADIDPKRRGETLSIEDFARLSNSVK